MRCPDCNKFTGLETQEPQCDGLDVSYNSAGGKPGDFDISASGTTERNCADCGTTLKSLSWDMQDTIGLDQIEGFTALGKEDQAKWIAALEADEVTVSIEEESTDYDESGGSRYKKITSRVNYTLSLDWNGQSLSYTGSIVSENAASEFEECC